MVLFMGGLYKFKSVDWFSERAKPAAKILALGMNIWCKPRPSECNMIENTIQTHVGVALVYCPANSCIWEGRGRVQGEAENTDFRRRWGNHF